MNKRVFGASFKRMAIDFSYARGSVKEVADELGIDPGRMSRRGKRMKKLRQSTVEPVLRSLVQHYGLRNINVLGKSGAHKIMLMAAVAFNIRKYMRNKPKKSVSMAIAMEREQRHAYSSAIGLPL